MVVERELLSEHLDVYDTRSGLWNPDAGDIEVPEEWELVPSGDAFVTRRVKAGGLWWSTLSVEERAELAARAYIRHRHTSYEDDLIESEVWDDEVLYRHVKRSAQTAVDDFLLSHRPAAGPMPP